MSNTIEYLPIGPAIGTIHQIEEIVTLDFDNKQYQFEMGEFETFLSESALVTIDKGKYR